MTGSRYELHCHLDASVRPETIADLARSAGFTLNGPISTLAVAPPDVGSLRAFLPYIDVAVDVLQTGDALHRAARELVEDWHRDDVTYGEARFAPQLHTRLDLTIDDAVSAVARGLADGESTTGVQTALLLCCLRHQSPDVSLEVADTAVHRRGLVAGLDLAGDEALPGAPHVEAFDLAHRAGLPVTVHAGEAVGPASVWEALDILGARRIGHGVRAVGDPVLVDRLVRQGIALETCPRCNVLTRAVPSLEQHPVDALLRRGARVTVSTDARTTADTTLDRELGDLAMVHGWELAERSRTQTYAREAAFGDPYRKVAPPTGMRPRD